MEQETLISKESRPNTRKVYEEHYKVSVLKGYEVHHILPIRLGGTHDPDNLVILTLEEHSKAHLQLYERYSDVLDLYASYMIAGRKIEAHRLYCSMGGKEAQRRFRERGDLIGFQKMSVNRRKEVASNAGRIGGRVQVEQGIGIHVGEEQRREWAILGGHASVERNGFKDSEIQSERGKKGGPKNKGFKWYNDGVSQFKYTVSQQKDIPFDTFLLNTGLKAGRLPSSLQGNKYYNDGHNEFMFSVSTNSATFEEFLNNTGFNKGRLK